MQHHSINEYQIGIICALPKELKAVRAIIDEEHEPLKSKDGQDENSYVLGRIGQHYVVAAGLPAGSYGTTSAASVSKDMLRTFPDLRFGLLVGIGGGVPNSQANRDVRLGDVVVSQPDAIHGGVVQYDLGKVGEQTFERRGTLNRPPQTLLTALTNIQANLHESSMIQYLQKVNEQYPALREEGYGHPGGHRDRLHCTRCNVSGWWWMLWTLITWLWPLWRCEECDNGQVKRPLRSRVTPFVHYGTIVSGNAVISSANKREQLQRDFGALCVEMEAAGLMNNFPCLVIRGICDYADGYKNDVWQEYAALTAAVYAKELLEYVSPQTTEDERPIPQILAQLDQHFERHEEILRRQEIRYHDDKHRNCHRVFKITDYESQKNINPPATSGTCLWVLEHPKYQTWSTSTRGDLLWISADPGCGKSVLSKLLVDVYLRRTSGTSPHIICYFFFKDNEQQNNVSTALCAIIHQLFSHQPDLIRHALPAFEKNGDKLQRDTHELWRIIQNIAWDEKAQPITCVLDALDECRGSDRAQLIDFLCQAYSDTTIGSSTASPLKWLVTSRPYDDVRDRFEQIPLYLPSIRLYGEDESEQIRREIDLVIKERVKHLSRELRLSTGKAEEILRELLSMEHRTYLWLYLAIEAIKDTFRDALRSSDQVIILVPASVSEAYERILARVSDAQRRHAKTVLQIIIGARRPLTIGEMALALDIATLPQPPDSMADLSIDTQQLGDKIRRWCGLFVLISDGRLYLLHQTAKEFLVNHQNEFTPENGSWKHCLPPLEVEKQLATICIQYLCLSEFNKRQRTGWLGQTVKKKSSIQTFFEFAAEHWADHTRPVEEHLDDETRSRMTMLYDSSSERWVYWTSIMRLTRRRRDYPFGQNHIQLAAFNGHNLSLQRFLQISPELINSRCTGRRTSLMWAAERGFLNVVQTLLKAGADVDAVARDYINTNALYVASAKGHEKVVCALLEAGANVDAFSEHDGDMDALYVASSHGYDNVVRMLLDAISVNSARGERLSAALFRAISNGHEKVVQLFLDAGFPVDTVFGRYSKRTALQEAANFGHEKLVRMLLETRAGVDAQEQERDIGGALFLATERGHERVVQKLLRAGADANALTEDNSSLLYAASVRGHEKIVQMLLDAGANVNANIEYFGSALHVALVNGHVKIVQMLLSAGADVNAPAEGIGSVLYTASARGHEKIVQMLLEVGADINAETWCSGSALHAALENGHEKIVQMLLEAGVDINTQTEDLGSALLTASKRGCVKTIQLLLDMWFNGNLHDGSDDNNVILHAASTHGHEKIVQMLLGAGADVNALAEGIGSPLYAASKHGHEKVVQMLLGAGADANIKIMRHFGSALHAASENGHVKIVQILLIAGADVNALAEGIGSALHEASANGHDRIVQMLLGAGADVNALAEGIGSALHDASANGHDRIVQMLLGAGADVNALAEGIGSPLYAASKHGHEKVVQMLLGAGADVNALAEGIGSPLYIASAYSHEKIVQILLSAGADVNIKIRRHFGSALRAASMHGHEKIVQMLLGAGADVNVLAEGIDSALHAASACGHDRIVQMLLGAEADVNALAEGIGSALHAASKHGHEKVVQMLLSAGANINANTGYFGSALYAASVNGHEKVVQMLIDAGADMDVNDRHSKASRVLSTAIREGYSDVARLLLHHGVRAVTRKPNESDEYSVASDGSEICNEDGEYSEQDEHDEHDEHDEDNTTNSQS